MQVAALTDEVTLAVIHNPPIEHYANMSNRLDGQSTATAKGNFQGYEKYKMRRLGQEGIIPHRVKYKKLTLVIAMISPCWRRMRTLGLPSYWGLLVPLLLALDYTYLFVVGNFWGASFSMEFLSVQAPLFAMTALVLIVSMALAMPPSDDEPEGLSRFGTAGRIAAGGSRLRWPLSVLYRPPITRGGTG
jgi:hypothetical protein